MPRLGLASRLILVTVAVVIVGQVINALILTSVERRLQEQRLEAVISERVVQAVRLVELSPRAGRRMMRRPGFRRFATLPPEGKTLPRAEALLREALTANGLGDRGATVREVLRSDERRQVVAFVQLEGGDWLGLGLPRRREARLPGRALVLQTLVLGLVLILPAIWMGRSVAHPLRRLTAAADGLLTKGSSPPLPSGGPPDIEALCRAFEALEQRTLSALEERSAMLGAVGHDLRTPLASLRIRVESVADAKLREEMIGSIESLSMTLDDILTFSRSTSRGTFEEVRTDALVRRLSDTYGPEALEVAKVEAVTILCAPESVLRALRNLIDNAVRYGGKATLSVIKTDREACFKIADDGPGIAEADLERLQAPFERGEASRGRSTGGAGLGLAIARGVAGAHGGELIVKNHETGGVCATIKLPRIQLD